MTAFDPRIARTRIAPASPLWSRRAFWCVVETLRAVGFEAVPYHAAVPTFGEWGFVIASREPFRMPENLPDGLRFLTLPILRSLFEFPLDMREVPVEVNQLNNQVVVHYHDEDWRRFRE